MRFNHAKKNTIESELIRLTSLILLSSIILCTIISNLILYKQNYENVKRYNNDHAGTNFSKYKFLLQYDQPCCLQFCL